MSGILGRHLLGQTQLCNICPLRSIRKCKEAPKGWGRCFWDGHGYGRAHMLLSGPCSHCDCHGRYLNNLSHSNELGGGTASPERNSAGKLYSSYCHSQWLSNGSLKPKVTSTHASLSADHVHAAVCVSVYIQYVCVCVRAKGWLIRFSGGWTLMTAERSIPLGLIWNRALHWWENYLSHSSVLSSTHTPTRKLTLLLLLVLRLCSGTH